MFKNNRGRPAGRMIDWVSLPLILSSVCSLDQPKALLRFSSRLLLLLLSTFYLTQKLIFFFIMFSVAPSLRMLCKIVMACCKEILFLVWKCIYFYCAFSQFLRLRHLFISLKKVFFFIKKVKISVIWENMKIWRCQIWWIGCLFQQLVH